MASLVSIRGYHNTTLTLGKRSTWAVLGRLFLVLPLALLAACQHGSPNASLSACTPDMSAGLDPPCAASVDPPAVANAIEPTGDGKAIATDDKPPPLAVAARARVARAPAPRQRVPAGSISLVAAVTGAVFSHPDIKVSEARVREANAGVLISQAGLYPTLEARVGVGPNLSSTYQGNTGPFTAGTGKTDARVDGGLFLRQLIFDFGATDADIDRARLIVDSERMKLWEKVEDIAFRTGIAYLRVIETRALLKLVDETIAAHKRLASIVQANAQEGNSTNADVSRVLSRLTDVTAIRSDINLQSLGAEEQFHRLTKLEATRLAPMSSLRHALPRDAGDAIADAIQRNPRLGAIAGTTKSIGKEIDFQNASALPKIQFEVDGDSKTYSGSDRYRNEFEGKALLSLRYRFLDGGLHQATVSQLDARRQGSEMSFVNEREQIEADVRQAYRAIRSASLKSKLVSEGVRTSRSVEGLYLEQFKAGRRTVFELLDSQMSLFSARRIEVESQFDGERAVLQILKATGRLTETLTGYDGSGAAPKSAKRP